EVLDGPFSAAQVVPSLLGSQVDAVVQLPAALTAYVKGGQLRLLTSMTASRDPSFPDVPTSREAGYDVSLEAWRGIAVPKGTPKPVIATLEAAIRKTVASAEFTQACERLGARPAFKPAAEVTQGIAREAAGVSQRMDII